MNADVMRSGARSTSWEDEPVTRGEYSRDLSELRGSITRLQIWIVGSALSVATIVTSAVFLHGSH